MKNIYKSEDKLWIGFQDENKDIILHPTKDISEDYGFPRSFIYEDDNSEHRIINNLKEMEKLEWFSLGYTTIKIDDITYLHIKEDKVISFLEDKFTSCKKFDEVKNFIKKYGKITLALEGRF